MPDDRHDLERIEDFLSAFEAGVSDRVVEWHGGVAYIDRGLRKIWDLNFLDLRDGRLSVEDIAAAADEILGGVGCEHRRVRVTDPEIGAALEPDFTELGWNTDVHVVMCHRREPNRIVDTSAVEEVGDATWSGRQEQMSSFAATSDAETIRQMRSMYDRMTRVGRARDFAIMEDGKAVSFALLFSDGKVGQIEDVATLDGYRQRGYSWRVMAKALEVSRAEHGSTFLIADDRDWPKDFYSRMGFDAIGRRYYFLKRPEKEKEPA